MFIFAVLSERKSELEVLFDTNLNSYSYKTGGCLIEATTWAGFTVSCRMLQKLKLFSAKMNICCHLFPLSFLNVFYIFDYHCMHKRVFTVKVNIPQL